MILCLNSDVLLLHSISVLLIGHLKRFDAICVKSDVLENEIRGDLTLLDGFSTLDMISLTFLFIEKALLSVLNLVELSAT